MDDLVGYILLYIAVLLYSFVFGVGFKLGVKFVDWLMKQKRIEGESTQ